MAVSTLKILRRLCLPVLLALPVSGVVAPAFADGVRLTAEPSSTEITVDENLSIQFKTTTEGMISVVAVPKYKAADFDEVNVYANGSETASSFINGRISMRQTKIITAVLRPRREGHLVISGIEISVNGQVVRAPDIAIDVRPSGARVGNRSNGTGYPQPGKLPNGGPHGPSQQNTGTFFIKTEPSKLKVYKGEQVILTYALYTRVQMMNIQVERYPNPNGFLKEDIDIPLLRGHLDYSPSVVNGHEFRRAALAQYAVFPLEVGSLPIDTFTAKFSFQPRPGAGADNDDDPFAMINNFFRAMQTTTEVRTSDRVNIEVLPLPGAGQPANFSGLVGDFDITAVADKTTVKAGEPINVKVKVEGKGHAGSLEHLMVKWPADFELYEDKSNTQYLKSGQSERLFEYMVIPKTKGHFEIPPIELSMFNPDTHVYQTRSSQLIPVEVLEGSSANVYIPKTASGTSMVANGEDIRYWKDGASTSNSTLMVTVARGAAAASVLVAALGLISLGTSPDEETRQSRQRTAQALKERAEALRKSGAAPVEALGEVESILAQVLELQFGVAIGSLLRAEVTRSLMDRARIDETTAKRVEALIELVEHQRYAPGGGDRASAQKAVEELARLVERIYPR
ncbi:MAG: BatD family protein [Deltaproteobacteria bacterium]|nr:BatD family protein [Deltaproteobacteria bacterium]